MLPKGLRLRAEISGLDVTIERLLGEGGQGAVYLVNLPQGQKALKWYHRAQATDMQRRAIRSLVSKGAPPGRAGQRFVWPEDLIAAAGQPGFGYMMPLIDTGRFLELGELWQHPRPPGLDMLCELSGRVVHSYRALHLGGYCYRDISRGNVMFDPSAGEVLICDNDNVGVNLQSECQVAGTLETMAPELVRGDTKTPSIETDLHALAVLLFQLWIWHHPFHGEMEAQIRVFDDPAKRRVYGETPVFVFDPLDGRNKLPSDAEYSTARRRWGYIPASLQEAFRRSFVDGVRAPHKRVQEGEWVRLFRRLKDNAVGCPSCRAVSLCDPSEATHTCWNCKMQIPRQPRLRLHHVGGDVDVSLNLGRKLQGIHVRPLDFDDEATLAVIGDVVENPVDKRQWGIRNLTTSPWVVTNVDGKVTEVVPGRSAVVAIGNRVNIAGVNAVIE